MTLDGIFSGRKARLMRNRVKNYGSVESGKDICRLSEKKSSIANDSNNSDSCCNVTGDAREECARENCHDDDVEEHGGVKKETEKSSSQLCVISSNNPTNVFEFEH